MVVVENPTGGILICVDLTKLNKYVKRLTHPGPSTKEVACDKRRNACILKPPNFYGRPKMKNGEN